MIVALLSLRVRHIPPSTVTRLRDELRGGFSPCGGSQRSWLTVLAFATTFLGNPLLTFLPLFAQNVFHGGVGQHTRSWLAPARAPSPARSSSRGSARSSAWGVRCSRCKWYLADSSCCFR